MLTKTWMQLLFVALSVITQNWKYPNSRTGKETFKTLKTHTWNIPQNKSKLAADRSVCLVREARLTRRSLVICP